MNYDRKAPEFNDDMKTSLEERGYAIKKIGGSISRPDIVAIKNKIALIIETKSEEEPKWKNCLTDDDPVGYDYHDECQVWRKYCNGLVIKKVVGWKDAIWMVHINLQALCYPAMFHKSREPKSYNWDLTDKKVNAEFEKYLWIPALGFPEIKKEHVQEAVRLMGIVIDEGSFMKLPKGQLLLKFDREQKMIEPPTS